MPPTPLTPKWGRLLRRCLSKINPIPLSVSTVTTWTCWRCWSWSWAEPASFLLHFMLQQHHLLHPTEQEWSWQGGSYLCCCSGCNVIWAEGWGLYPASCSLSFSVSVWCVGIKGVSVAKLQRKFVLSDQRLSPGFSVFWRCEHAFEWKQTPIISSYYENLSE